LNVLGLPQSKIRIGVLGGSRQSAIITENNGTAGKYANLEAVVSLNNTLEELVEGLNSNTTLDALFIDGPTAQALLLGLSETGLAPDSSIRVVQNVVDETASQVSKGLGIAVPSKDCQLYVNIQKAITDMINDGTLARLRQEFRLPAVFTPVTAELAPVGCTLKPTINSNAIANYIFTNYCPRTVIPETTAVGPTA
jgi:hypothetical protein